MELSKSALIQCPSCRQKTPLQTQKVFDDFFNLLGEKKLCSFCKYEFKDEDIPFAQGKTQKIFDPNAERRICEYCRHYVVNPWTQKCMLWMKEVTATDSCEKFEKIKTI